MRTGVLTCLLAGLCSLVGTTSTFNYTKTEHVARHYEQTWFAPAQEKRRCGALLRTLAGDDLRIAFKIGLSIDEAMRATKCLDRYSYIYGPDMLPVGASGAVLSGPSVDTVGPYLFLHIASFQIAAQDLVGVIGKIDPKTSEDIDTVVIDIRGNAGGYIDTLHELLDRWFAPRAGVRYLKLEGEATFGKYRTTSRTGLFSGRNIRILTDSDTGSSSEWLIETLCYEWYPDKCTTLGSKTVGKSLLQCINRSEVTTKLTCGEWLLPPKSNKDQSRLAQRVQGVGIEPDLPLNFDCERYAYGCIALQLAEAGL